ncbi:DUF1415 domain-containing protein [Variovorax sp. PBL-E5]|uniref:DUF1415 domain-containing protein n=1 Tax=Variovorax sp. PBL-E5 TaxID=434014 RepID=UPI00131901AC|nr:DUF1415 domain-containing protein [Variovorax sp. PBL-E5]VTU21052.1 hypothetical protein E5CHR_01109 [Variovorax sp. PBL-E5]
MSTGATISAMQASADTRRWLEVAVIGLNLCPFAKAVHVRQQIHYDVYLASDAEGLLDALLDAAQELAACEPSERDTTLLIAPNTLADFLDFNDFVVRAERGLARAGFEGQLQLANFHPRYQFAGTDINDVTNATNRSPYPTLHLLREDSVSRAVDAFPDAEAIFGRNIQTLEALGAAGWEALNVGPGSAR